MGQVHPEYSLSSSCAGEEGGQTSEEVKKEVGTICTVITRCSQTIRDRSPGHLRVTELVLLYSAARDVE